DAAVLALRALAGAAPLLLRVDRSLHPGHGGLLSGGGRGGLRSGRGAPAARRGRAPGDGPTPVRPAARRARGRPWPLPPGGGGRPATASPPCEHPPDAGEVALGDVRRAAEAPLPGGRLLLEDVVHVGLPPTQAAGAGRLEALGGTAMGLHLRHA